MTFVITESAYAFVIMNMGFLTAGKAESVITTGMREASSSLLVDGGIVARFVNTTNPRGAQSDICLTMLVFYIKLSQGHEPINVDDSRLMVTFTTERSHGELYNGNGTMMTIKKINGDLDNLL